MSTLGKASGSWSWYGIKNPFLRKWWGRFGSQCKYLFLVYILNLKIWYVGKCNKHLWKFVFWVSSWYQLFACHCYWISQLYFSVIFTSVMMFSQWRLCFDVQLELQRNEVIALMNLLNRLSESVSFVYEMGPTTERIMEGNTTGWSSLWRRILASGKAERELTSCLLAWSIYSFSNSFMNIWA